MYSTIKPVKKEKMKDPKRKYSDPSEDKKELWKLLSNPKLMFSLNWGTRAGSLISAMLTAGGTYLRYIDLHPGILFTLCLLFPIVIEGLTLASGSLFSRSITQSFTDKVNKVPYLFISFISLIFLCAIGYVNVDFSTSSGVYIAEETLGEAEKIDIDYKDSDRIKSVAATRYAADSLRVIGEYASSLLNKKKYLKGVKNAAYIEINRLESDPKNVPNSKWFPKEIAKQRVIIKNSKNELKTIDSEYKTSLQSELDVLKGEMLSGVTDSEIKAQELDSINYAENGILKSSHDSNVSKWSGRVYLGALIGVFSALFRQLYTSVSRSICGVKLNEKDNDRTLDNSLLVRTWDALIDIIIGWFEVNLVEQLESKQRKNIRLEEERLSKIESDNKERQLESDRILLASEKEKATLLDEQAKLKLQVEEAKQESERKEKEMQEQILKQRREYEDQKEIDRLARIEKRKQEDEKRKQLELKRDEEKKKRDEIETLKRQKEMEMAERNTSSNIVPFKPRNEAATPMARKLITKKQINDIAETAIKKYPSLKETDIKEWVDTHVGSQGLEKLTRGNFERKQEQLLKRNSEGLTESEEITYQTRCCKIEIGSSILNIYGTNVYLNEIGKFKARKRKEGDEIKNDFAFKNIKVA